MSRIFGKEHCEAAQGQLKNQKFTNDETWDDSVREITLIENMTSFLEANAGQEVDQEVLRNMAKTLSKRINVTNPGTFKDVTMENSYGVGYRSPCVSSMRSPPIQGHSVREFDEQLKALNKENFNLKLRIFFIEESIPGLSKNPDTAEVQENLFRQLVEVKVDREALRKDIEEKQKILQQAADAMTQMENKEKETEEKNQALIEELQNKIEALESELCNERMQRKDWEDEIAEPINSKNISENLTTLQRLRDVEIALKQAEEKILEYQTQNMSLDDMLQQRDQTVKEYEENILRLNNQNAEIKESLKEALGVAKQAERLREDLRELKIQFADKTCMLQEAEEKIAQRTQTIIKLMNSSKNLQEENSKLKRMADGCISTANKERSETSQANGTGDIGYTSNTVNHSELQQSISDAEYAKALESNKLLQREVDLLTQCLAADRDNESLVTQLRHEVKDARADAEKEAKWRLECVDVCTVLSKRLEELAGFLNTLLKHKDVLGVLAADRRRAMRKAVDRSLDLSKSLNMTLSVSGVSLGDQSMAQLSNLSVLLGDVEEIMMADDGGVDVAHITFNSHEEMRTKTSIETLQEENKLLKKELAKRRCGENKKDRRSLAAVENHSESEAWSEPDRIVSLARIGLEDNSTERLPSSALLQHADTDTDTDVLNQSRNSKTRATQERVAQLEQMISERDDRIVEVKCQLLIADNELEELRLQNNKLTRDLQEQQNSPKLQQQIQEKTCVLEQLHKERDQLAVEAQMAAQQIDALKNDIDELRLKHEVSLKLTEEQHTRALQQMQLNLETRALELEQKHEDMLARDFIARELHAETVQQLTELQRQYTEAQRIIEYLNENEQDIKQVLLESEMKARSLKKQLDESTLLASKTMLERTKALNDKLQMEKHVQQLTQELSVHETERRKLQCEITELTNKIHEQEQQQQQLQQQQQKVNSDVSQSGYTSEELLPGTTNANNAVKPELKVTLYANVAADERLHNSSPDLGIESDAGRVSSVDNERKCISYNEATDFQIETTTTTTTVKSEATSTTQQPHDCAKVDQENIELRRKLIRTKRLFEDTYQKLRAANQQKAIIEKNIQNEILKTHNVLLNVRNNIEK